MRSSVSVSRLLIVLGRRRGVTQRHDSVTEVRSN
jgi:hypothetical protein